MYHKEWVSTFTFTFVSQRVSSHRHLLEMKYYFKQITGNNQYISAHRFPYYLSQESEVLSVNILFQNTLCLSFINYIHFLSNMHKNKKQSSKFNNRPTLLSGSLGYMKKGTQELQNVVKEWNNDFCKPFTMN